jgi:hypothetical protein
MFYQNHTGERREWLGSSSVEPVLRPSSSAFNVHSLPQAIRSYPGAALDYHDTMLHLRAGLEGCEDEPALMYSCGMECNRISPKDTVERPEAP